MECKWRKAILEDHVEWEHDVHLDEELGARVECAHSVDFEDARIVRRSDPRKLVEELVGRCDASQHARLLYSLSFQIPFFHTLCCRSALPHTTVCGIAL